MVRTGPRFQMPRRRRGGRFSWCGGARNWSGIALAAWAALCVCPGAAASDARALVSATHRAMGTDIEVQLWAADAAAAEADIAAVFALFSERSARWSPWVEESDIARLNRGAGGRSVAVGGETMALLSAARGFAELTGGAFDPTVGAFAKVWRFAPRMAVHVPSEAAVRRARALVDYRALALDIQAGRAGLRRRGMRLQLGGIAKGFAVDAAVRHLRAAGYRDFLVQAGGDLYAAGARGHRPWRVGIRDPRGPKGRYFAVAEVRDATFSTSGDYERFFVQDGVRYHHIVDPRTGWPARRCRSVTIWAPDATLADALSTAVFVMGAEPGRALLERFPGVGAVVVDQDNRLHITPNLRKKVRILWSPTPGGH